MKVQLAINNNTCSTFECQVCRFRRTDEEIGKLVHVSIDEASDELLNNLSTKVAYPDKFIARHVTCHRNEKVTDGSSGETFKENHWFVICRTCLSKFTSLYGDDGPVLVPQKVRAVKPLVEQPAAKHWAYNLDNYKDGKHYLLLVDEDGERHAEIGFWGSVHCKSNGWKNNVWARDHSDNRSQVPGIVIACAKINTLAFIELV